MSPCRAWACRGSALRGGLSKHAFIEERRKFSFPDKLSNLKEIERTIFWQFYLKNMHSLASCWSFWKNILWFFFLIYLTLSLSIMSKPIIFLYMFHSIATLLFHEKHEYFSLSWDTCLISMRIKFVLPIRNFNALNVKKYHTSMSYFIILQLNILFPI